MEFVLENVNKLDFSQPLSLRTIRLRTRVDGKMISKRLMLAALHKSGKYRNVKPLEVGNGKHRLNVWTRV